MSVKESKNFNKDTNELLYGNYSKLSIRFSSFTKRYFNKYCENNNIGQGDFIVSLVENILPDSLEEYLGSDYYNSLCEGILSGIKNQINSKENEWFLFNLVSKLVMRILQEIFILY